ncbi:MAG: peptidase, partial [Verrucomicrobiales bacterium]|nr:peptidase [Verrucomicrobiales bacterium]
MVLLGTSFCSVGQEEASAIKNIFNEELSNGHAYTMLDHLANRIGGRLSGSPQAAVAVEWGKSTMESMGIDRVWLQEVMVPHWVRGEKEQASITVGSKKQVLRICALGNSIGTGPKGIAAAVIEVKSFLELEKLGKEKIAGNIVFFNR